MDNEPDDPAPPPHGGPDRPSEGLPGEPLLTLEPLLEAVTEGLEEAGWELSGVQKTTSHRYEGRWEGEASRSAYLFFHRDPLPDAVSLDVFLDETTDGLKGNLALVVQGPRLGDTDAVPAVLERLADAAAATLPEDYRTPLSFRLRLSDLAADVRDAGTEVRFKLHLPGAALDAGGSAVAAVARAVAEAFEGLLERTEVRDLLT